MFWQGATYSISMLCPLPASRHFLVCLWIIFPSLIIQNIDISSRQGASYLGVCPLLVPALTVASGHLNLLLSAGEGVGDGGTAVLTSQLVVFREGEELSWRHEVVTDVLAEVVARWFKQIFMRTLKSYTGYYLSLSSFWRLSRQVLLLGFLNLPWAKTCLGSSRINFSG